MDKEGLKFAFWMMVIVTIIMVLVAANFSNGLDNLQTDFDALLIEKQACGDGWYEQLELTATLMAMIEERENHQSYCPEGNWRNYFDGLREELELCRMDTP